MLNKLSDIEIEQHILGACMLDNSLTDQVVLLDDELFYFSFSKKLLQIIKSLHKERIGINKETCKTKLDTDDIDMVKYFYNITDTIIIPSTFNSYKKILIDFWRKRELQKIFKDDMSEIDSKEYIAKVNEKLFELMPSEEKTESQIFMNVLEEFEDIKKRGCEMTTGFPKVDDVVGDLRRGKMYVLGAHTSGGKSSLSVFLAHHLAYNHNKKVLFFSLEMGLFDILAKLTSIMYGIENYKFYKTKYMTNDDEVKFAACCAKVCGSNLVLKPHVPDLATMLSIIKEVKPDVVFIDHIQYIARTLNASNKTHEIISNYLQQLKYSSEKEGFVLFMTSQLKQPADKTNIPYPKVTDYAESANISRDADVCLALFKPPVKYLEDEGLPETFIKLCILKVRHGGSGEVGLDFDKKTLKYIEYNKFDI